MPVGITEIILINYPVQSDVSLTGHVQNVMVSIVHNVF